MRLNLGSVAGNMPIVYSPSAAAHTQLMAPYYNEDEIITSLANFESMDDDELYEATARARGVLLHWQNEFYDLDDQMYQAANGSYQREPLFGNPRPTITTKPISTKTALARVTNLSMGVRATGGELDIDMNNVPEPEELPAKRVRKAPVVFDSLPAPSLPAPAPTITKRKRQEPNIVESIETESQPPAKKRATRAPKIKLEESTAPESSNQRPTRARSTAKQVSAAPESSATAAAHRPARARPVTKPAPVAPEPAVRRSTRAKSITKAPSAAPEPTTTTTNRVSKTPAPPKKRATRAKSATKEPSAAPETKGKDPKRSAAMKASWAKRKAAGTNGRDGGAPVKSGGAKKGGK